VLEPCPLLRVLYIKISGFADNKRSLVVSLAQVKFLDIHSFVPGSNFYQGSENYLPNVVT
jgi:hypothetical protein